MSKGCRESNDAGYLRALADGSGEAPSREAYMGSMRIARSLVGVGALLLAVLVAGCEEDEPSSSPPASDSPSVPESSSPTETTSVPTTPVEPTLPAQAEDESQAGAEAFVRFYWEVVNYATKTGDVTLLSELDQVSCEGCDGGVDGIERVYRAGGRIVGGDYDVVKLETVRSESGQWTIVTHTRVGAQRAIDAGKLNRRYPAGRDKWLIALARVHGAWSVSTLESL
jgi:hypothetical protein